MDTTRYGYDGIPPVDADASPVRRVSPALQVPQTYHIIPCHLRIGQNSFQKLLDPSNVHGPMGFGMSIPAASPALRAWSSLVRVSDNKTLSAHSQVSLMASL